MNVLLKFREMLSVLVVLRCCAGTPEAPLYSQRPHSHGIMMKMDALGAVDFRSLNLRPTTGARHDGALPPEGPADGFQHADVEPPAVRAPRPFVAPQADEAHRRTLGFFARTALLATCGATLFTGVAAAMPSMSWAAESQVPSISTTVGVTQSAEEQQKQNILAKIPQAAREMYDSLSKAEKLKFKEKVTGSTRVGFFTVDNREAVIKGTAFGFDVFSKIQQKLDESVGAGRIDRTEHTRQTSLIKVLSALQPEHREGLITLLAMDIPD